MKALSRGERLARLLRVPPSEIARRVAREARWRTAVRREELRLARAASGGRRIVVGPFVGEIGFELLYWIPMLRRLLHGVDPGRVTAFTRGGAAVWYRDFASSGVEVFDYMQPEEFVPRLAAQRGRARDAKLLDVGGLERELLARARDEIGDAAVIHPLLMYGRLRWAWFGAAAPATVQRHLEPRRLEPPPLPPGLELPQDFVAVKAYFSRVFPDEPANRAFLSDLVGRLGEVVLLTTGRELDDHEEWDSERVHRIDSFLEARDNLAVQTAAIARARALVATYGGFSYLGPLLGVPTTAFHSHADYNPAHLDVVRMTIDAPYALTGTRVPLVA